LQPPPSEASALFVGEWRSLVAHLFWEQRVAGSNPVSPTIFFPSLCLFVPYRPKRHYFSDS
jgi:hypothetical protein